MNNTKRTGRMTSTAKRRLIINDIANLSSIRATHNRLRGCLCLHGNDVKIAYIVPEMIRFIFLDFLRLFYWRGNQGWSDFRQDIAPIDIFGIPKRWCRILTTGTQRTPGALPNMMERGSNEIKNSLF